MKILYVLSYISRNGGVQSVVNNYLSKMDTEKTQIEFLTLLPGDTQMEEEWRNKGCKIYHIGGSKEKNLFLFLKEIRNFFKEHHDYDIIHSHQTNLDIFYLREAKKWKIPVRIMHTHTTGCDISKFRMNILRFMSKRYANYYFACSKEAGRWMFGKNIEKNERFYVINNAIDVKNYIYNEEIRRRVRKENNLEDCFVVGNVARMVEMKNHKFLIEVFEEILKVKSNAKLLLIGDGPLRNQIEQQVTELNINKNVIFYGVTDKVNEMLQAMDVFVIPSFFEGGPITMFEAAASGMKYIISERINRRLLENDLELQLDLSDTPKEWANRIIEFSEKYERRDQSKLLIDSEFDLTTEAKKLQNVYQKILKEKLNK